MTYAELAAQLEELAAMVAGWTPIVPPAVATVRVAARLRALAREVAAGLDDRLAPDSNLIVGETRVVP